MIEKKFSFKKGVYYTTSVGWISKKRIKRDIDSVIKSFDNYVDYLKLIQKELNNVNSIELIVYLLNALNNLEKNMTTLKRDFSISVNVYTNMLDNGRHITHKEEKITENIKNIIYYFSTNKIKTKKHAGGNAITTTPLISNMLRQDIVDDINKYEALNEKIKEVKDDKEEILNIYYKIK